MYFFGEHAELLMRELYNVLGIGTWVKCACIFSLLCATSHSTA